MRWVLARANSRVNEDYLARAIICTNLHGLKLAATLSDATPGVGLQSNVLNLQHHNRNESRLAPDHW